MRKSLTAACLFLSAVSCALGAEQAEIDKVPTDFLRDVMMPIGLPVVTSYHALRESVFLNTRTKHPHPIEGLGNFFLAPSQYLFAARKISLSEEDPDNLKIDQAFHYKRFHWFKTLTSLIALPVSEVLGTTFKGLSYLSPEVRKKHRQIKRALKSTLTTSKLDIYRTKGIADFHTEEFIPCQEHKRPSKLTKNQQIEIAAMQEIINLLDAHNILYWIDCGTCLGAYRYGGFIPWDWDIDLSILLDDHDNVKKLLSTLDPKKYQIQDWSSYSKPKTFLKLYVKETKNFIDIYHYQINEEQKTVGYLFTYIDSPFPDSWKKTELKCIKPLNYDEVFPLKRAKFDNLTVWAPNNVVTFLQSKYGENLDPAKVWDEEAKTYHKVENHPYYD